MKRSIARATATTLDDTRAPARLHRRGTQPLQLRDPNITRDGGGRARHLPRWRRVRHGGQMMPRRPLLLVLAVLLATSGCVSVPAGVPGPDPATRSPAADALMSARVLPNVQQPRGRSALERIEDDGKQARGGKRKAKTVQRRIHRRAHRAPAPTRRPRTTAYAPAAVPRIHRAQTPPAPARKHLRHPSSPHRARKPRPRSHPSYTMRPLCRKASQATSPEVAALCRSAYGS